MTNAARSSPFHVALYGEIDCNVIDGASVWLGNVARMLSENGFRVSVILRAANQRTDMTGPMMNDPAITVIDPISEGLAKPDENGWLRRQDVIKILERLHARDPFERALLRGFRVSAMACKSARLRDRLWVYLTDIPQPPDPMGLRNRHRLRRIGRKARVLLCQTPELADHIASVCPSARSRFLDLPPILNEAAVTHETAQPPAAGEPLRLVYAGKFAPDWNTLEMTRLPKALNDRGVACELHVIGDKFQRSSNADYPVRMKSALEATPNVIWHGGMAQGDALKKTRGHHVGLSWRAPRMDGSLELSSKVLEYGALGVAPLLNPTPMHQRLFGPDYPLFAATFNDVVDALVQIYNDPERLRAAAATAQRAVADYRFDAIAANLVPQLLKDLS